MCLDTTWKKPEKATKDITVYKTLKVSSTNKFTRKVINGKLCSITELKLMSPRNHVYELGKTYKIAKMHHTGYSIERAFHAYDLNPKTVKRHYQDMGSVVVECVVPKGALYYKGTNNGTSRGIASNQIKAVKIV